MKKLCLKGNIFLFFSRFPRKKKRIAAAKAAATIPLLLAEGLAVSALVHGGVTLMGANQDPVQGAIVCLIAMMGALCYGTFDALVCVTVHTFLLLLLG